MGAGHIFFFVALSGAGGVLQKKLMVGSKTKNQKKGKAPITTHTHTQTHKNVKAPNLRQTAPTSQTQKNCKPTPVCRTCRLHHHLLLLAFIFYFGNSTHNEVEEDSSSTQDSAQQDTPTTSEVKDNNHMPPPPCKKETPSNVCTSFLSLFSFVCSPLSLVRLQCGGNVYGPPPIGP